MTTRKILRKAIIPQQSGYMDREVVLCLSDAGQYHPYVTWIRNSKDGATYYGHYFKTEREGTHDFNKRVKEYSAIEVQMA